MESREYVEEVGTYRSQLCPPKGMEGAVGVVSTVSLDRFYRMSAC